MHGSRCSLTPFIFGSGSKAIGFAAKNLSFQIVRPQLVSFVEDVDMLHKGLIRDGHY